MMSTYKGWALGCIGDFGTYSFHETKNYTMGEGGLIFVNREEYVHTAEIIREKGTNRSQYFRGEIDKYSWVDKGSSYLPSELNMAYLLPQLEIAEEINNRRCYGSYITAGYRNCKRRAKSDYLMFRRNANIMPICFI